MTGKPGQLHFRLGDGISQTDQKGRSFDDLYLKIGMFLKAIEEVKANNNLLNRVNLINIQNNPKMVFTV
jgi:hypothetical protein